MNYEVIYNVGILDDVHNYFPSLLYDTGRFTNLQQVFHYIRTQMNTRFNLYSYGASRARPNEPQPRVPVARTTPNAANAAPDFLSATMLLNMMNSFELLQPVVVAPSAQTIATSTEILSGDLIPESVCTICQDSISRTDTARKITSCGHIYHKTCIDQWFLTSVHCPTCRHDIRILPS